MRHVRKANLERLEPLAQAIEPHRRVARQSRQHRVGAYRRSENKYKTFNLNSRQIPERIRGSDKVVLERGSYRVEAHFNWMSSMFGACG